MPCSSHIDACSTSMSCETNLLQEYEENNPQSMLLFLETALMQKNPQTFLRFTTVRPSAIPACSGAVSKVRIDSVATKCLATKAEQHNILSESITSQKTSLAIEKHGKHKKPAKIDFSGAKGVVFLSSDYHIINDPQIIAEQCLANKTYQDDGDQAPISKNEEKMHGGAVETDQASSAAG